MLSGTGVIEGLNGFPEDNSSRDIPYLNYAPITSIDVERSFSVYKTLLSNNRRSFKFENIRKHIIIQCNYEGTNCKLLFNDLLI
jgi:hypothetical protein